MLNVDLFFQIFNLNGKWWLLDQLMIFASTSLIYLTFLLSFVLVFKGGIKERKALLLIILGLPIAVLLIKIIHLFYFEPRPFVTYNFLPIVGEDVNASFPSRHATISSIIAFSFSYFRSKWAILFLFIVAWISFSRIYVGVHYPLDIIGGFITAAVSITLAMWLKKFVKKVFLSV